MQKILKTFLEPYLAFRASAYNLERSGLNPKITSEFIVWRRTFNLAKHEMQLAQEKIDYLTWDDSGYPPLLREILYPPYILYYRGNIEAISGLMKNRLAIVGARKHSAYAEKIIDSFLPPLIKGGIEIISGLALGIDTLAHQITLKNGGLTIAVLGSGLDAAHLYPPHNKYLAENIIKNGGALISEFPPGTPPLRQNFPQRNRLISGLAQATLVIEAKIKSGALITADHTLDQNREVLAIPGNIYSPLSEGTNNLIRAGAHCINSPQAILEIFNIDSDLNLSTSLKPIKKPRFNNEVESLIYKIIQDAHDRAEIITADEIIKKCKLDTAIINSTLSMLELRGFAKNDGIGYYID